MKFSSKLTPGEKQRVNNLIMDYTHTADADVYLMVSDGEMSRIVKEAGLDVSVSFIQRARKSLGISSYRRDFSIRELQSIGNVIMTFVQWENVVPQMTVTDADMCRILSEEGYSVNPVFVQRMRQRMGINARGVKLRKFTETQFNEIQEIIREYTQENDGCWKLKVSDGDMAGILCASGFSVNVKYVERVRKSLGIEALGERGGARCQDPEYANLISLHDLDVYRLSYRSTPSGALRGQSGTDVRDRFGCHTTDLEDAINRKSKELLRSNKNKTVLRSVFSDIENDIDTIEGIFAEEVDSRTNDYGKKGKGGNVYNIRTAQVLTSI